MAAAVASIPLAEEPLASEAWVYPCTLADLQEALTSFPEEDLAGLSRVMLAASTRKDWKANGRYSYVRNEIRLYSLPASYEYRLNVRAHPAAVEELLPVECAYGMQVEVVGRHWLCRWEPERLRHFILKHVLAHEVGHHVYHRQRYLASYEHRPRTVEAEQFAEHYALRQARCRGA